MLKSNLVLLAAAAGLMSTPALAEDRKAARTAPAPAVMVCENTAIARQAWKREHGPMTFVSAEQVVSGRVQADAPAVCITAQQLARVELLRRQARMDGQRLASR